MRKDEVLPAAVEIEGLAEILHGHGRALDVPPRTARTPGAGPRRLAQLGSFPEREVQGIALRFADLDPHALAHVVDVPSRELAVLGIAPHVEVDVDARGI